MKTPYREHPSYGFARRMLKRGEYFSVTQCLIEYQLHEVESFFDKELAEKNIRRAVEDYNNEK